MLNLPADGAKAAAAGAGLQDIYSGVRRTRWSQRFAFVTRDRWWMTAFLSALNIDTGFRAFDLFLLDGVPALFRLGLALLQVQF